MILSRFALAASAAFLASVNASDAATFTYALSVGADNGIQDGTIPGQSTRFENQTTAIDFSNAFTRSFNVSDGSAGAVSSIQADPTTGELKLFAAGTSQTDPVLGGSDRATSTAFAEITVFETFRAAGSGTVTFNVDFDGVLDSSLQGGNPLFVQNQALSSLTLRRPGNNRNEIDQFGTSILGGALGLGRNEIEHTTSVSLDLVDGQSFDFVYKARVAASTNLFGTAVVADSQAAFDNTFKIGFLTTDGLQVSSNSNFLSGGGTDPMSPVPVPAALPLLLAGIGSLAALHRRSREAERS